MPVPLLTISLFVLGLTGSLWTTLYAFMVHQYERWEFLDTLIDEAVFQVAMHDYVVPMIMQKLREWTPQPGPTYRVYAQLRGAMQLNVEEMDAFQDRCLKVVRLRRLWHRPAYIARRVRETCAQYHWRIPVMDDLLEYVEGV